MLPSSAGRVEAHTHPAVNRRIDDLTHAHIERYSNQSDEAITQRLEKLDEEWDTERTLQTNFAILSSIGAALCARGDNRWAWLALGVPAFMVQHALQGWCPPLAVLRRLGVRTSREINEERFALKALRGDFDALADAEDAEAIVRAVQQ